MKIKELRHELYNAGHIRRTLVRAEVQELLIFINEYYSDEDDTSSTDIVFKIFNITDKC